MRRPHGRAVAVLGAAALAGSLATAAVAESPPGVGGSAPPFEAPDVGGTVRKVGWGDAGPAATVVYFFDPQSSDCLLEMSFLDALFGRARDFGLAVYAVESRGRQPAEVSRSLERYCALYREPSFPVLPDPSFRVTRLYGVREAPVTYLTESHGVILNRLEGYGHEVAVAITRRVEQLLRRERGFFSEALRSADVSASEEREIEARLAAAAAVEVGKAARPLAAGDRIPSFEFTDMAGRSGLWGSPSGGDAVRLLMLWGGGSLPSVEGLTWLDALSRRGRDLGLEVVAVEASGMDVGAVQTALERYRRYHPPPSFRVVADPQGSVLRVLAAAGELPQIYLVAADGTILHHTVGFDRAEAARVAEKVEKAFVLAGRPFPPERGPPGVAPAPGSSEEAPSIRTKREQEEKYRSNIVQGDAYFTVWEFERALPYYLAALRSQPKDLHALRRAAEIYERRGEAERAVEYWERLLGVRPDDEEARSRIQALRPRP